MYSYVWKRTSIIAALIAGSVVVLYLYVRYDWHQQSIRILSYEQKQLDMRPVGELTKVVRLRQLVDVKALREITLDQNDERLCLGVLMANYSDRNNSGSVLIGIDVDGQIELKEVRVKEIKDNVYHYIYFDDLMWSDLISAAKIEIILNGVDGQVGKSVTAWSTKDLLYGNLVSNDGRSGRSLLFRLGTEKKSTIYNNNAIILILLALIAIFIFIIQPVREKNFDCSDTNTFF